MKIMLSSYEKSAISNLIGKEINNKCCRNTTGSIDVHTDVKNNLTIMVSDLLVVSAINIIAPLANFVASSTRAIILMMDNTNSQLHELMDKHDQFFDYKSED